MKYAILLAGILLFFAACKEEVVRIPPPPPPTDRIVLMEEFSGGNCVPCGDGAALIRELSVQYNENFIPLTIHTFFGSTSDPYDGAKYDFRTDKGNEVMQFLGLPNGLPSAVFNRTQFEGEADLQHFKQKWANIAQSALSTLTQLDLSLESTYDKDSRTIDLEVTIVPQVEISGDIRMIAVINESHLIDKQAITLDGTNGVDNEFEHNHILRDVITATSGESLGTQLAAFSPISRSISYVIPQDDQDWWIPENMEIIVFVVNNTSSSKEVLQAKAVHFTD